MNKWYGAALLIPLIFFVTGGSWFIIKMNVPKRDMVQQLCALKPSSERQHYLNFVRRCADQNLSYGGCVKQFITAKKDAAIAAVQNEWDLDTQKILELSKRTDQMLNYMHASEGDGIAISFASWLGAKKLRTKKIETDTLCRSIKSILRENGVRNLMLEVLIDSRASYPTVYFHDITSNKFRIPHFLLELPEGFDLCDADFQRGNLEHELMHVACGHSIFVHDLSHYLAERDHIPRGEQVHSESIAKLMRAYEYEADLLPSLKHPQTAYNVLLALDSVKTTDEAHPPTRKRKKMVSRVMRLGQYASSIIQTL